jgi:hypothetical protein
LLKNSGFVSERDFNGVPIDRSSSIGWKDCLKRSLQVPQRKRTGALSDFQPQQPRLHFPGAVSFERPASLDESALIGALIPANDKTGRSQPDSFGRREYAQLQSTLSAV